MTATLLLTGADGQLGRTFRQHWQDSALAGSYQLSAIDMDELDLTRQQALRDWLDARRPQIIVNAAAYTAVERAEQQQALAYRVNAAVVRELALWCRANQAVLVQLSTDFVFDGGSTTPMQWMQPPTRWESMGAASWPGNDMYRHYCLIGASSCALAGCTPSTATTSSKPCCD